MTLLLIAFVAASMVLWLSVYGYLALLAARALGRVRHTEPIAEWPDVAVVIPTLNEEQTLAAKLADLARTDYPADKLHVVVVDGGSTDRTVDLVRAAIADGVRVHLWRVDAHGSKARQVNAAMERLSHQLVVVTDADARLDPSCVRELIGSLVADPQTAIVGASIRVATDLLEERLHWWGINRLWWLEGEALSAGIVSGVCYAARRSAMVRAAHDARAEDAHLALHVVARGLRVRLSRTAWATEVRVPRDTDELLRFRQRRGTDYLRELRRVRATPLPVGARIARAIRLFHFRATPVLGALALLLGLTLLASPHWRWPVAAGVAFMAPPMFVVARSRSLREIASPAALLLTAGRLVGLLWMSLMAIRYPVFATPAREGRWDDALPRTLTPRAVVVPKPPAPRIEIDSAAALVSVDTEAGS